MTRTFTPRYPEKYIGNYPIISRSSWEMDFMNYCDNHPDIIQWASEPLHIPYSDPLTGKQKIYIPDFMIIMVDRSKNVRKKIIEIKPMHEQLTEHARNSKDLAMQARNRAKWGAAIAWCTRHGIEFDVINESNIYNNNVAYNKSIIQYAPSSGKNKKHKKRSVKKFITKTVKPKRPLNRIRTIKKR